MWRKLAIFLVLVGSAASVPARAFAQPQNPPPDSWFAPWPMWDGWPSWWWICPLMMVLMMLVMMFVCRSMSTRHRD